MTRDDEVRSLLSGAADAAPVHADLLGGARRRAGRIRRRRLQAVTAAGTGLATVALLLGVSSQLRTGGEPVAGSGPSAPPAGTSAPAVVSPATPPALSTPAAVPSAGSVSGPAATPTRPPAPGTPAGGPRFGPPVLAEDFATGLDRARWAVYDSGDNSPLSAWSAAEAAVRGGALQLTADRTGPAARPYRTGGVGGIPLAREYGRFTVRLRMTAGTGVIGQVGLVPAGSGDFSYLFSTAGDRRAAEILDAGTGRKPVVTLPAPLTATRTLVVEWSPRLVRWTLDGTELARSAGSAATGPHYLALQVLAPGPDCAASPLPAGCAAAVPLPQVLAVDGVTIQPYTGG